jgi:hypothetical protein
MPRVPVGFAVVAGFVATLGLLWLADEIAEARKAPPALSHAGDRCDAERCGARRLHRTSMM